MPSLSDTKTLTPITCWSSPTSTHTTPPLVSHCHRFHHWLTHSNGHTTILTVIDRFSKACRLIPLPKLPTALETAEHLCNRSSLLRYPRILSLTEGPNSPHGFGPHSSRLGNNVSLTLGTILNLTVKQRGSIRSSFDSSVILQYQPMDWSRSTVGRIRSELPPKTGHYHPFQCPGLPTSAIPLVRRTSNVPAVTIGYNAARRLGSAHLTFDKQSGEQVQADRHEDTTQSTRRTVGMAVCPWPPTTSAMSQTQSQVRGSFQITRQITPVSFELNLPNHYRISPTFHVSLLKPADDPGEGPEEPLEDADPLPISREERRYTGARTSRFQTPGSHSPIPGRLGGLRPGGKVLGRHRGYSGSQFGGGIPQRPPGKTGPQTTWRPGVDHLLASGAARRGGALSRRALLRLPLLVIDGNHHPSISLTTSPSSPVPGTHYLSHLSPITWAI